MYLTLIKTFLTANKIWLKIAAIAILTVMCLAYVYNAGKESERSVWQEKESDFLASIRSLEDEYKERAEDQQKKHEQILLNVMSDHNEKIQTLNDDVDKFKRDGLRYKSKASSCSNARTGEAESSSLLAQENEYELPARITERLSEIGEHAIMVQQNRNELIDICSQYVQAIPAMSTAQ